MFQGAQGDTGKGDGVALGVRGWCVQGADEWVALVYKLDVSKG